MPEFPRVADAIHSTLEYYKLAKIKTHIKILSGKEANPGVYESSYETVFLLHKRMGEEMDQTLTTSTRFAQVYLFEVLKEWLEDYRVADVHIPTIEAEINKYNHDLYSAFLLATEKKMEDYCSKYEYVGEGGEYEEEDLPLYFNYKPKKIFRKIYCIETIPDFIDTDFLEGYLIKVNQLLVSLRANIYRYIKLYNHLYDGDQEKTMSIDTSVINNLPQTSKFLQAPDSAAGNKLKVSITIEQLTVLFRLLKESKIIEAKVAKVIQQFIADNFEIEGREGIPISAANVAKLWSSTDTDVLNFLIGKLIEMQKLASRK